MLQCADFKEIPHHFILPKRGPEQENLKIKVFVTGRVSPCVHCQGDHRSSQCPSPLSPRHEPRPAADSQSRDDTAPAAQPAPPPPSAPADKAADDSNYRTPSLQSFDEMNSRPSPSPNEKEEDLSRMKKQKQSYSAAANNNVSKPPPLCDGERSSSSLTSNTSKSSCYQNNWEAYFEWNRNLHNK